MTYPEDMKIGQAVRFSDFEGRWAPKDGHAWCSYCGESSQYPADEVMVIRHYKVDSTAGTWIWYCPDHFTRAKTWKNDHLAPEHLQP